MKDIHAEKVDTIAQELNQLRKELPGMDKMKMGFDHSALHKGKMLINATHINFRYNDRLLWKQDLTFQVRSGERIAVKGPNGSGKTTLIKMILAELQPISGTMDRAVFNAIYIDQDYSLVDNRLRCL